MKNIILLAVLFTSMGLFAVKSETVNHRIQSKETLFRISLMYNSTVNDIVKANPGLNPKSISAGMTIKVPKDTKIRDAEFVASFLNPKQEPTAPSHTAEASTPLAQVIPVMQNKAEAPRTSTKYLSISQLAVATNSEVITESRPYVPAAKPAAIQEAPARAIEKPVEAKPLAAGAQSPTSQNSEADENPFLTPSEPRTSAVVDDAPAAQKVEQPSSADNSAAEEDENPFMSPKPKSEGPKEHK